MKKNKMMRIASFLLVAVLMSTCAISGTFAKYVTSDSADDSARVAKWGVTITANGHMFEKTYNGIETGWTSKATVNGGSDAVVAPGTSGEMVKMTLSGTPEVAVRVTYEATNFKLDDWTLYDGTTEYCPVVFTVAGATYGMDNTDATNKSTTIAALETAIKNAIKGYSKEYGPGTTLSDDTVKADSLAISWSWAIGVDDTKDTILGNKAAGIAADGTSISPVEATISITIKTTVTQID